MYLASLNLLAGSGETLLDSIAGSASSELIALADRLARVFSIASPFAPGLHCIGGEVVIKSDLSAEAGGARLSVTGNGETAAAALVACLGETAEFLSQFERKGDIAAMIADRDRAHLVADGWIAEAIAGADRPIDWIRASDASTGAVALLPADLCLRRPLERRAIAPPAALSSGVAAGRSFEAAALRAVLELCERDAAAMWWLGGRRPRHFALDHPALKAGAELIERLRRGVTARRTLLLDITTDNDVPAVAAVSVDHCGRGLACGLSSRLDASDAAKAAILEMCQMEMAAPVAEAKRDEGGDAALNEADRRHLRRAEYAATDCELLHPWDISSHAAGGLQPGSGLKGLLSRLQARGVRLYLLDHTRQDVSVAVVRAVSPDLQPFTTAVSTRRFAEARRDREGENLAEREIPLL